MSDHNEPLPPPLNVPALDALVASLRERFGPSLMGVLMYGSCLRSGDYFDGLVDLYLVVDNYTGAYGYGLAAAGNWLLPPNVFYAEAEVDGRRIRSKYAVVSARQFARCNSSRRLESYFWGRFSQPVAIVYGRSETERQSLMAVLAEARATFLRQVLPALPASGTVEELWQWGLAMSYNTELRSERAGRAGQLVAANRAFYTRCAQRWAAEHPAELSIVFRDEAMCFESHYSESHRLISRWGWVLRRGLGKLLSLTRLLKGFFTFDGGLDYVVWKLERHTGQQIAVPDKVRRWPLFFLWGFCWRLYRRGLFK